MPNDPDEQRRKILALYSGAKPFTTEELEKACVDWRLRFARALAGLLELNEAQTVVFIQEVQEGPETWPENSQARLHSIIITKLFEHLYAKAS
jgi:hypothetical protein